MRLACALAVGLGLYARGQSAWGRHSCLPSPSPTPTCQPTNLPAKAKPSPPAVTEAQVQRWLKSWQKRLALDDWEISAHIVRSRELKRDTLGNLRWNSANKTATIRVMDALDYDLPAPEIQTDMEYTVVHELLHLQLAMLPRAAGTKDMEERVVNRLGEALFSLEKGPRYRPRTGLAHISPQEKSASEASRSAR